MKIPQSFKLYGKTIQVELEEDGPFNEARVGAAMFNSHKIKLTPSLPSFRIPKAEIEETFIHELVHWILHEMQNDLTDNEDFVEGFAKLLHQALTTQEGETKI